MTIEKEPVLTCDLCDAKVVYELELQQKGKLPYGWTQVEVKSGFVHLCYNCKDMLKKYFIQGMGK